MVLSITQHGTKLVTVKVDISAYGTIWRFDLFAMWKYSRYQIIGIFFSIILVKLAKLSTARNFQHLQYHLCDKIIYI